MESEMLENTGETVWNRLMFYKEVVQVILIYGSDSWVITESMMMVLEGFYH